MSAPSKEWINLLRQMKNIIAADSQTTHALEAFWPISLKALKEAIKECDETLICRRPAETTRVDIDRQRD